VWGERGKAFSTLFTLKKRAAKFTSWKRKREEKPPRFWNLPEKIHPLQLGGKKKEGRKTSFSIKGKGVETISSSFHRGPGEGTGFTFEQGGEFYLIAEPPFPQGEKKGKGLADFRGAGSGEGLYGQFSRWMSNYFPTVCGGGGNK